jgi:hypothetical protein
LIFKDFHMIFIDFHGFPFIFIDFRRFFGAVLPMRLQSKHVGMGIRYDANSTSTQRGGGGLRAQAGAYAQYWRGGGPTPQDCDL